MNTNELMLTNIRRCRRVDLYADPLPLNSAQTQQLAMMQTRQKEGEPIQYILGECEFFGLNLKVDHWVLIPRPETEILVEQALVALKGREKEVLKILDLGTGSGNIAIALAKNLPSAYITTVDISEDAIELAKENASRHDVSSRVTFIHADMRDFFATCTEQFDLIISNPPYVSSDELDYLSLAVRHEPRRALDGGIKGLKFYEPIFCASERLLKTDGMLFLEFGDGQRGGIEKLLTKYPRFHSSQFIKDFSGIDRIVQTRL